MSGGKPGIADILALVDDLNERDRGELMTALAMPASERTVLAAIEGLVGPERRCPHCQTLGAQKRGKANKLVRYQCMACGRTFNALTGTPLSRLKKKEKWLDMAISLSQAESLTQCQERCGGISRHTALRWRHRLLGTTARRTRATKLAGTTEMDTTYVRESEKGSKSLKNGRKPRKRGGPKGPTAPLLPVLMAVQRGGDMLAGLLQGETAGGVRYVIADHLERGAVVVTDAAKNFRRTFRKMGLHHEPVNTAAKQRVRGPWHIQTVNGLHARFKRFMTRFNGVATKYLANYIEWFRTIEFHHENTRFSCLAAVIAGAKLEAA